MIQNCAVDDCHKREYLAEIEQLRAVVKPLLESYLATFNGNKDQLALDAERALEQ